MKLLNHKETRPNKEPDLETLKRARQKGNATFKSKKSVDIGHVERKPQ